MRPSPVTYLLAWVSLFALSSGAVPLAPIILAVGATALALAGLAGSRSRSQPRREAGWLLGAVGLGALAVAWVAAVRGTV